MGEWVGFNQLSSVTTPLILYFWFIVSEVLLVMRLYF